LHLKVTSQNEYFKHSYFKVVLMKRNQGPLEWDR